MCVFTEFRRKISSVQRAMAAGQRGEKWRMHNERLHLFYIIQNQSCKNEMGVKRCMITKKRKKPVKRGLVLLDIV